MIGKLIEHILEAGFDVSIQQHDGMLVLRIAKMVEKELCTVDWVLSRVELATAHYVILQANCDDRLHWLQDAIAQKTAAMGGDPKKSISFLPACLQKVLVEWIASLGKTVDDLVWWEVVDGPLSYKAFTIEFTFTAIFTDKSTQKKVYHHDVLRGEQS